MARESEFDLPNILKGVDNFLKGNPVPAAFDEPKEARGTISDEFIYLQKSFACDFLKEHFDEVLRRGWKLLEEEVRILKANFVAWRIDRSGSERGDAKKLIGNINLRLLNEVAVDHFDYWSRESGREVLGSTEQKLARKNADNWSPIAEVTEAALE